MQQANIISRQGVSLVWQAEGIIGEDNQAETVQYTCRGQIRKTPYWQLSRWLLQGTVDIEGKDKKGSFELWLTKGEGAFDLQEAYAAEQQSAEQSAVMHARKLTSEDEIARQTALQVHFTG